MRGGGDAAREEIDAVVERREIRVEGAQREQPADPDLERGVRDTHWQGAQPATVVVGIDHPGKDEVIGKGPALGFSMLGADPFVRSDREHPRPRPHDRAVVDQRRISRRQHVSRAEQPDRIGGQSAQPTGCSAKLVHTVFSRV